MQDKVLETQQEFHSPAILEKMENDSSYVPLGIGTVIDPSTMEPVETADIGSPELVPEPIYLSLVDIDSKSMSFMDLLNEIFGIR